MSCSVCNGYPGCPCCTPEPRTITCPACGGTGEVYYNDNGDRITEEEYSRLTTDQRECESCGECDGSGVVEDDYEPDYDSMPGGPDFY